MPKNKKKDECDVKPETVILVICSVASLVLVSSLFITSWRHDSVGLTPMADLWTLTAKFDTRGYGLLQVRGSYTQTWTTLTQTACDFQTIQAVSIAIQMATSVAKGGADYCFDGVENCDVQFLAHIGQRCTQYEAMERVSKVTLIFTFLAFICCIGGAMMGALSQKKRTGGITFGLFMAAVIFTLITSMTWALVTDAGFKKLGESAWYPYPSLGVAWYLHLSASLTILVCDIIWGFRVLPEVCAHDPAAEKLKKHMKRMDRMKYAVGMGQPQNAPYWQEQLNVAGYQQQGQQTVQHQMYHDGQGGNQQGGQQGYAQQVAPTAYGQSNEPFSGARSDANYAAPAIDQYNFTMPALQQPPSSGTGSMPPLGGAPQGAFGGAPPNYGPGGMAPYSQAGTAQSGGYNTNDQPRYSGGGGMPTPGMGQQASYQQPQQNWGNDQTNTGLTQNENKMPPQPQQGSNRYSDGGMPPAPGGAAKWPAASEGFGQQ